MILYLDSSAIVKRYVAEHASGDVVSLMAASEANATSLVSRAEVAAALARAVRLGVVDGAGGRHAQQRFAREWTDFVRVPVTEALVARAGTLAWDQALRGYDAIQLAAALAWQEAIGLDVTVATFDRKMWETAPLAGLQTWPPDLEAAN